MNVRALVERLSRRVVLKRRLPAEYGGHPIYVSPDASLRFWRHDLRRIDPQLLSLCSELVSPGLSIWDIGANVGLFSMAAAGLAGDSGTVLAVEADPFLVGLLRRSSQERPPQCATVDVVQAAISNRSGVSSFSIARRSRAASHLESVGGSSQSGGARETLEVATMTLDDLLDSHLAPQLVKIDVEGAELLCLEGATRLLSTVRPVILCEVATENSAVVATILRRFDYVVNDASLPSADRRLCAAAPWSTLALPQPSASGLGRVGR